MRRRRTQSSANFLSDPEVADYLPKRTLSIMLMINISELELRKASNAYERTLTVPTRSPTFWKPNQKVHRMAFAPISI